MENASKALLLAGSLLISLVVISMLMLVINSLTSYQSANEGSNEADILAAFNAQYESYNREDVRGNDLFTLARKVIDYNRRKTASIDKDTDVGKTIGYQPITVMIDFKGVRNNITIDNKSRIFLGDLWTVNGMDTVFNTLNNLEAKYPKESLNRLATGITKIFIDLNNYSTDEQKQEAQIKAINNFNTCYGSDVLEYDTPAKITNSWKIINGNKSLYVDGKTISRNVKNDVYTYYEYVQFKRGIFKCTKVERDDYATGEYKTGRIVGLTFEFTGVLN